MEEELQSVSKESCLDLLPISEAEQALFKQVVALPVTAASFSHWQA